jgi:microcystin-dependent protein
MATQGIKIENLPEALTVDVTRPNNYIILSSDTGTLKIDLFTLVKTISSSIYRGFNLDDFLTNDCIKSNHIKNGEVNYEDLAFEVRGMVSTVSLPVGAIIPFAKNEVPSGWLACNGDVIRTAALGTTQNISDIYLQNLRAYLGTTFGSYGTLPDLRGYFVRGHGVNGDQTTSESFGRKQTDSLRSHTHTTTTSTNGAHTHPLRGYSSADDGGLYIPGSGRRGIDRDTSMASAGSHTHTVTVNSTGGAETRPKNIALLYCIKY